MDEKLIMFRLADSSVEHEMLIVAEIETFSDLFYISQHGYLQSLASRVRDTYFRPLGL